MTVHNLKSSSDGGILDPDDELSDVADDREQVRDPRCDTSRHTVITTTLSGPWYCLFIGGVFQLPSRLKIVQQQPI